MPNILASTSAVFSSWSSACVVGSLPVFLGFLRAPLRPGYTERTKCFRQHGTSYLIEARYAWQTTAQRSIHMSATTTINGHEIAFTDVGFFHEGPAIVELTFSGWNHRRGVGTVQDTINVAINKYIPWLV